ncbi:WhiB family transcriptional regulator [Rhodococcus opacus]|uniref:WhiB family transcriptional regulator n=1 Tax=Rhodococcus opacus TaxID=37919 RepID=UPI001FF224E6|nr:WhiB family transcriptional regulator [Rhodococcus opacus]UOT03227.1 WhiB family transcriptional regulator [Rhodococcus opacus]
MTATEYSSDRTHNAGCGWWHRGSCRGSDADMFFAPDDREQQTFRGRRERFAKQICQDCPVLTECRTHALTAAERYGIWGGLFESERARLARKPWLSRARASVMPRSSTGDPANGPRIEVRVLGASQRRRQLLPRPTCSDPMHAA